MRRDCYAWYSPHLGKTMELVAYGHYGFALLLFPSAAADYLEYERFYLIDAIRPFIERGLVKVYSINSINSESWLNGRLHPRQKILRHQQYNAYVAEEVVPFIWNDCHGRVPIITGGVSLGAYHAANTVFRRADLFDGTIAMSGTYDLSWYTNGYWDEDCYYNSPVHYLPNLNDSYWLPMLRGKRHLYFMTGQGPYEHPESSIRMGQILGAKGIPNYVDLWGREYMHDWPTWRAMLPNALERWFMNGIEHAHSLS